MSLVFARGVDVDILLCALFTAVEVIPTTHRQASTLPNTVSRNSSATRAAGAAVPLRIGGSP